MRKLFFNLILFADSNPTFWDKVRYLFNVIAVCAPVAYLLDGLSSWFDNNKQFFVFVLIAIAINMAIGMRFHKKRKTFSWEEFWKRSGVMIGVLIIVYILLEQIRIIAGDNWAGEGFRVLLQLITLLYPTSKALKNVYILSGGQHPPEFIMKRLYHIEKTGDLAMFFKTSDIEAPDDQTPMP